jgi:hypothetical protein
MKQERLNRPAKLSRWTGERGTGVQARRQGLKNAKGPGDTVMPGKFRRKEEWAEYKCKDWERQQNSL